MHNVIVEEGKDGRQMSDLRTVAILAQLVQPSLLDSTVVSGPLHLPARLSVLFHSPSFVIAQLSSSRLLLDVTLNPLERLTGRVIQARSTY